MAIIMANGMWRYVKQAIQFNDLSEYSQWLWIGGNWYLHIQYSSVCSVVLIDIFSIIVKLPKKYTCDTHH